MMAVRAAVDSRAASVANQSRAWVSGSRRTHHTWPHAFSSSSGSGSKKLSGTSICPLEEARPRRAGWRGWHQARHRLARRAAHEQDFLPCFDTGDQFLEPRLLRA